MKGKRIAATCVSGVLTLSLGFGMVGCGNNKPAETTAQTQQTEKKEEEKKTAELQVLGTKKDGAQELKMKNGLSSAITAVSLRVSGEQAYQSNLVESGKKVAANEEVLVYVDGVKADANYDIRVTKEGGGDVEFLAIPVSKIASLTLKEADGKTYVDYVGTDKKNGSTKDAAAAAGTAAAVGAAAAGTAAAAAGQDSSAGNSQSQESTPATTETTSDSGYVPEQYYATDGIDDSAPSGGGESSVSYEAPAQTYEAPAQTYEAPAAPSAPAAAPSAPAQTEDVCVPDVVLR